MAIYYLCSWGVVHPLTGPNVLASVADVIYVLDGDNSGNLTRKINDGAAEIRNKLRIMREYRESLGINDYAEPEKFNIVLQFPPTRMVLKE